MTETYDVIVLGAGSTGENVADRAVRGGLTAVLIEEELVGGDCSYWACMPSKALLRGSEALAAARAVPGAAEAVTGTLDVAATLRRRDAFTSDWRDDGQVRWAASRGIDVLRGHGRLTGPKRVTVDGDHPRQLTATHAVAVCTGSAPATPPIPGLAAARPWTTREATSAQAPPESMVILGGGAAGCELAAAWAALGTAVTIIERSARVLSHVDTFAGDLVAAGLREGGVDVRTGVSVTAVHRDGAGPTTVETDGGPVTAAVLLVSTGRRPRLDDLGLDTIGLADDAWLTIDDHCRVQGVDGDWLFAAGDITGRHLFTHQGKYQARICGDVITALARGEDLHAGAWSGHTVTADHLAAPAVIFTDPQVATVGRTEAEARDAGLTVRTVEYDIGGVAGASLVADHYVGHAKLVIDEERRTPVGATFVGPDAAELVYAATVAIAGEVPLDRLWHAVPAYPTVSEVWLRLLEAYGL